MTGEAILWYNEGYGTPTSGEMAEWLKAAVPKTARVPRPSKVRILLSPFLSCGITLVAPHESDHGEKDSKGAPTPQCTEGPTSRRTLESLEGRVADRERAQRADGAESFSLPHVPIEVH